MKKYSKGIIFTVILIDLLGFGIIIPLLPIYASKVFSAPETEIGLLFASYSAAQFLFGPIWGRLSDEIGRKPIIILSLAGNVVAYILFAMANSLTMLFISRILAGLMAGNISAAQAYMADISTPKDRAKSMGLIGMAFSLGFVLGPFLGGFLSKYGYSYPGYFAAGLSLCALIFASFRLVESLDKSVIKVQVRRKFNLRNLWDALNHPNIGIMLIMFFMLQFAFSNAFSVMALLFDKNFSFTVETTGFVLGYIGLISAIVQGFIGILTRRIEEKKILILSNFLAIFGMTFIPLAFNIPVLILILTLYAIGMGINFTIIPTIISQFIEPEEQGGTLGLNQSLGSLGRVAGPSIAGFIFGIFGHSFPFFIGGMVITLAFIMSFYIKDRNFIKNKGVLS